MVINKIKSSVNSVYRKLITNKYRKNNENTDFSIICSNCIGGVISHLLGLKFLSPTVNLWIPQKEFIKMVCNLKEYMNYDLCFIDTEQPYPVGLIKDVHIHFNHYHSKEEAKEAWYRRRQRINYDNLWIIMYDRDGVGKEDILQLENAECRDYLVISSKVCNIPHYLYMRPTNDSFDASQCMDIDAYGIYAFEKQFDFVEWLNSRKDV